MRALAMLVPLLCALSLPAAAQRVRGELVDDAGKPVSGAFVSLRDAEGRVVARALTGDDGRFSVQGSAAGTYRVRAERIGFAGVASAALPLAAGEERELRLVAPGAGVALQGLVAQGRSRCEVRPQAGQQAARLWEEARKAIEATTWSGGDFRFTFTEYERDLDPSSERVRGETSERRVGAGRNVWRSRAAAELARVGYREERSDGIYFFAPDANLLLSDDFLDTHCFDLHRGRPAGEGLVGLAFRPVRRTAERVDVEGVVWLDRATAELRHLDFRFTGLPPVESHDGVGGRVEFARLPGGAWIVRRWRLRMPLVTARAFNSPTARGTSVVLDGLRETGGYVQEVAGARGNRLFTAESGTLEGVVVDAGTEAPLAGARVSLVGTQTGAVTDAEGRFRIAGLDEGRYAVTFRHPRTDSLRYSVPAVDVVVRMGAAATVRMVAPTAAAAIAADCRGDSLPVNAGILAGTVRNRASGAPLADARVAVWWSTPAGPARGEVASDSEGRYRFCGAPVGVPLNVRASFLGRGGEGVSLTLASGQPTLRDLTTFVVSAAMGLGGQSLEATGATAVSVQLRVVDAESGDPVPGARVRFGEGEEPRATDRRGSLVQRRVSHGTYRVDIEHPDYGLHSRWLAVGGGATMEVTFQIPRARRN